VANASLGALHDARPQEEQCSRVEEWLHKALARSPDSMQILVCLGDLQDLRGRYQDAKTTYRKVLERNGRDVIALNNLAWLLVFSDGRGEEALVYVNRAIAIAGPIPELLDTRALASLLIGNADAAIADLQDALTRIKLDPKVAASIHFHLAQALLAVGKSAEAAESFKQAKQHGFNPKIVHPLEATAYTRLASAIPQG